MADIAHPKASIFARVDRVWLLVAVLPFVIAAFDLSQGGVVG